jgi:Tfp pilus assembly protein PilN
MMYFRINLNKLEDPSVKQRKELIEISRFALLSLGLLMLLVFALYWNIRLGTKVTAFERQRDDLKAQIKQLEDSRNFISEQDVRSLSGLDHQRVFWAKKLETLAAMTGDNIALTSLKLQNENLYLEGIAKVKKSENNFNMVSDFIERIKQEPAFNRDFQKIEFGSSSRMEFMDQTIIHFEILCYPK